MTTSLTFYASRKTMARVWIFTHFIFSSFTCMQAFDFSKIKVPKGDRIAGIFMIPESGEYLLNSTDAKTACQYLNVTIATRAQMEKALQLGLETCKFGWIDEEIVVVPRIKPDERCGSGKTGLVTWRAKNDRRFCTYCFRAADLQSTPKPRGSISGTSESFTMLTALTQAATTSPLGSKPKAPATSTTKGPELAPHTSAFTPLSTRSSRSSSTSPPIKSISSTTPRSLSHLGTSLGSVAHLTSSTSAKASTTSSTGGSVHVQSVNPVKTSLGVVPLALIVLGIIVLLLTAAGVMWYYKLSIFPSCSRGQQKDDIETEMWKHTDSEADLHQHDGEEETDKKYSSDITLCANPDITAHSTE